MCTASSSDLKSNNHCLHLVLGHTKIAGFVTYYSGKLKAYSCGCKPHSWLGFSSWCFSFSISYLLL